jgi:aminoglycoside phosphotransferase (APT) family kinase protein
MCEVDLPAFAPMTDDALAAVAQRYGETSATPLRAVGIFNALFGLGERLILRVPRDHPDFLAALAKEPLAVPAARAVGVRTPALVDYDDTRTLLPVPYTVYERVQGETFGLLSGDLADASPVWRELGVDLARLHRGVGPDSAVAGLSLEELPAGAELAEHLAERGVVGAAEADWLLRWLRRLDEVAGERERVFAHGDIQSTNVMVAGGSYSALLDWGACGWGDPAVDFAGIPMRAVPAMLGGYAAHGAPVEVGLRAAIVRRQLRIGLLLAHRPPQPGLSWAERPLGVPLDLLRFLAHAPVEWRNLRPPR